MTEQSFDAGADDEAMGGESAGYVPCLEEAAALPAVVDDANAVAGDAVGRVPDAVVAASLSEDDDSQALAGSEVGFVAKACICTLNLLGPGSADRGATGTCVAATKHVRSSAYPGSTADFIHFQLYTFGGSSLIPRLTSQWIDTNVAGFADRVSDDESYNILSYVNPLYGTTGANRARLTGQLWATMPAVLGVPEDQPLLNVPWTMYACDIGDPKVTYGLSGSTPVSVSSGEWDNPGGGSTAILSGVHPGGDQVTDFDVTWDIANPQWVQFFLRSYATDGSSTSGSIYPRLHMSAPTPIQWIAGVTAYDQPNRGSPNLNSHLLYICP